MNKFSAAILLLLSACYSQKPEPVVAKAAPEKVYVKSEKYTSNYERLSANILVKNASNSSVTYEYKDVRIDEIGLIAAQYCFNQGHDGAILKESWLHKNFSRRATFNCVLLP